MRKWCLSFGWPHQCKYLHGSLHRLDSYLREEKFRRKALRSMQWPLYIKTYWEDIRHSSTYLYDVLSWMFVENVFFSIFKMLFCFIGASIHWNNWINEQNLIEAGKCSFEDHAYENNNINKTQVTIIINWISEPFFLHYICNFSKDFASNPRGTWTKHSLACERTKLSK